LFPDPIAIPGISILHTLIDSEEIREPACHANGDKAIRYIATTMHGDKAIMEARLRY
jgi:hypothetical protein